MAAAAQPHYASASLYVGDLAPDVNETMLFEVFNAIGPVASIRVCRESGTRKSLGYAYVNYHSIHDAEQALDTLNFTAVKGNPCRIMWSHRDPSLRKSGSGNIFVKNLDKSIDNKSLYDTFSLFGNILSCKVATDEFGKSRGYGFVHYETEEAAKKAAEKVNGMLIGARNVFVGPFKKRSERQTTRSKNYTNLYVKHFPETWTDETLHKVFIPFGSITSYAISTDAKGRRFGFVNFDSCDSARAAVTELHGKRVSEEGISEDQSEDKPEEKEKAAAEEKKEVQENGKTDTTNGTTSSQASGIEDSGRLYVQRAMTKGERIAMLKEQFNNNNVEKQKQAQQQQQQGVNLYVKNLDDQVTDEGLSEAFSKYGTVTSAKVMRDESGASKGFGFVCFAFPDDATKAVTAMHLKLFMGKPLYVGLAEKRDHRTARLQQRFRMSARPNVAGQPMVVGAGNAPQQPQIVQPFGGHMYYGAGAAQQQGGAGPLQQQQRAMPGPGFAPPGGAWRQQAAPRGYGGPGGFQMNAGPPMGAGTPMYPYQQQMGGGPDMNSAMGGSNPPNNSNNSLLMRGMGGGPRPRYSGVGMQQGGHMGGGGGQGVPNFKFTPQARNRDYPQSHHPHAAGGQMQQQQQQRPLMNDPTMMTSSGDLLSAQSLAAAHPQMQKQMLGEKLFPLVAKHQPELAGKITGMMLEMDNGELLSLLESEVQLQAKVDEALGVLHRHQAIPGGPQQQQQQQGQSGGGVGGNAAAAHSSPINPAA